jgi:hypothetical protein
MARGSAPLRGNSCEACHSSLPEEHPGGESGARACSACHVLHASRPRAPLSGKTTGAPWTFHGAVEAGARAVGVSGSRTRFRQDTDLSSGAFLREVRLEARRDAPGAAPDVVVLSARDLGDPFPGGRLDLAAEDLYSLSASADRETRFGVASRDFHALDLDRTRSGARARFTPWGRDGPSLDLGAERFREEGTYFATSTFNIAEPFSPAPGPTRSTRESFGGGVRFEWAGLDVALRETVVRTDDRQKVSFEEPSAFTPGATNLLDRSIDSEGTTYATSLSLRRRFPGEVEVAVRARYADSGGTGGLRSHESGAFAGNLFIRDESGKVHLDEDAGEAEGSLSFPLAAAVHASFSVRHTSLRADSDSRIREIFQSPPGTLLFLVRDNARREESVEDLAGLDLDAEVSPGILLRAGGQAGQERFDVEIEAFNNTIVDTSGRLGRLLLHAGAGLQPSDALSLDLDVRGVRYDTHDEFYREAEAEGWEGLARARWNPLGPVTLGASARIGRSTIDLFVQRNRIRAAELDATFSPWKGASASLFASRSDEVLAATPTVLVGLAPVEQTLTYDATTDLLAGLLEFPLDPRTRLRTEGTFGRARGSAHVTRWLLGESVEHALRPRLTLGGSVRWTSYETDEPTSEPGYDAVVADVLLRIAF